VDMDRFSSAAYLASWAGMCPGNHESAGKHASGKSRPGDPWLKGALGLAATAAARSKDTYLAARYKRIAVRRGKKRALVAVGHTILTSVWHMLANDADYHDLGGDYFIQRTGRARQTRRLVSQLNMLGYQVSLQSAEAV
jgi:transposase